jgi:hypothetical protein
MAAALTAGGVGLGAYGLTQVPRMFASNLASEATAGLSDLGTKLFSKLPKTSNPFKLYNKVSYSNAAGNVFEEYHPTKLGQALINIKKNAKKAYLEKAYQHLVPTETQLKSLKLQDKINYNKLVNEDYIKLNFTKPLKGSFATEDELYEKYFDRVLTPINRSSISLQEFKDAHSQAIKNLKGLITTDKGGKEIGLEIRNLLADRLKTFKEPTVTQGDNLIHFDQDYLSHEGRDISPLSIAFINSQGYNIKNLTPQQLNMIDAYTRGYDNSLNAVLRDPASSKTSTFYQKYGDKLNEAILKNKVQAETNVRRGIGGNYTVELLDESGKVIGTKLRSELTKGDRFIDKGFLSTSFDPKSSWGNADYSELITLPGGGIQSIAVPNASSFPAFRTEEEVILPKGLMREITDVIEDPEDIINSGYKYKTKILNPYKQGGPIYNWIPNYPRVGAKYADGGDTTNARESTYVKPVYKQQLVDENNPVEVAEALMKKHNVTIDSTGNMLKDIGLPSAAYYNPITRTINYKNPSHFPKDWQDEKYVKTIAAEIPHAVQADSLGTIPFLYKVGKEGLKLKHDAYSTPGTIEHEAHSILQPTLQGIIFNNLDLVDSPMIHKMRKNAVEKKAMRGRVNFNNNKKQSGGWLDNL